jgi:hypothetical protein
VGQAFQPAVRLDVMMLDEKGRLESLPHNNREYRAFKAEVR